jgi:hypothetical protein
MRSCPGIVTPSVRLDGCHRGVTLLMESRIQLEQGREAARYIISNVPLRRGRKQLEVN